MPHDLDVERRERQQARQAALGDRTFIFGGETFTHVRDCPWDIVRRAAALEDPEPGTDVLGEIATLCLELIERGEEIYDPAEEGAKLSYEPPRFSDHDRFWGLLHRKDDPITTDDVSALLRWLMGAASGRPTQPPLPLPDGSEKSGSASTGISSLQPAVVSPI